jgi:hypothetical protein
MYLNSIPIKGERSEIENLQTGSGAAGCFFDHFFAMVDTCGGDTNSNLSGKSEITMDDPKNDPKIDPKIERLGLELELELGLGLGIELGLSMMMLMMTFVEFSIM